MLTIEEIKAAGEVPESFYNIKPGCAIFYAAADGISSYTKELVLDLFDKCGTHYDNFRLKIKVADTTNTLLENTIVAKRLNVGSLYRYNLLIARVNCQESVDAFVKEFFNLMSRDDEPLKFINKKPLRSRYDYFEEPSFAPTNVLHMIVMRPREEEEDTDEYETDSSPEQRADLDEILQKILDYADKYKQDIPKNILYPLAENKYVITEDTELCKLIFKDREFWLKAGTTVKLKLSKLQSAFYLLMLAHPEGIESRRLSEHKDELIRYYYHVFKGGGDDDKVYKDINNLIEIKELDSKFEMPALKQLKSKLNKVLTNSILNRTNQLPFRVQNTNGLLHVDLPRKFFECEDEILNFKIKE